MRYFTKRRLFSLGCHTHTRTKCVGESQRVLAVPSYDWGRDCIYDNETLDKHAMFLESKWTLLISFSWPLLKLEPQIHAGCLGFTDHLLLYSGLTQGERGFRGDTLRGDDSQLPALQMQRKTVSSVTQSIAGSWCVNITGSINLTVDLSLARYVCVSLIGVDKGHFADPRGIKCWKSSLAVDYISADKFIKCRLKCKVCILKHELFW